MIYPAEFPTDRESQFAERTVFKRLQSISDKYDIFYSRRFINNHRLRKRESEIDFIIAKPHRYIIVLEVKGGIMKYDGSRWFQNNYPIEKSPEEQAISNCHFLVKKYKSLSERIPFLWMLCFPDCEISDKVKLPPNISRYQILDRNGLYDVAKTLRLVVESMDLSIEQKPRYYFYENFKSDLLRSLGFSKTIGTTIKYQEEKFVELTNRQLELIEAIATNKRIIIKGAAGSGKTILAKQIALRFHDEMQSVLFLCFNRLLANNIRYNINKRDDENLTVSTFHSLARELITSHDPEWWERESSKYEEFWNLEVPVKLDEVLNNITFKKFRTIVIDEGQDFKELWFEIVFKLSEPDGNIYIFMDSMQDIFNHFTSIPDELSFFQFNLNENLRNTKKIVQHINLISGTTISSSNDSPEGSDVVEFRVGNKVELISKLKSIVDDLTINHRVDERQLLILVNGSKSDSPIANLNSINNFKLKALDRKARFEKGCIHFSNIETFKGLEQDIVIVIDVEEGNEKRNKEKYYTQASRAKHKLIILNISNE